MSSQTEAERLCTECGGKLSRYNDDAVCSACAGARPVAESDESAPWLQRSDAGSPGDDVAVVLATWRKLHGYSQAGLAALLDTSQQHLSQYERGLRPVDLEMRRKLVDVLAIPPEDVGLAPSTRRIEPTADGAVAQSRARWRAERHWLNRHRSDLARLAVQLYPAEWRVPRTPLIAAPGWQLSSPVELRSIGLDLSEARHPVAVDGSEPASEPVRPLRTSDVLFDRYTAAIRHLDAPRLFESRPSYRLLGADLRSRRLDFGMAAYFDKLDISEAVGHETALACMDGSATSADQLRGRLPLRELIDDPFDPLRRAIIPAITTLTIRLRRHPEPPTFLLHWRDPSSVATAAGIYDVIPAGEFQPSSVNQWDRHADFDLWRNVVREYSEELLGMPEHDGTRSTAIDYDGWPLFQRLGEAQRDGTVQAHLLGLGLDALTLAATILTVVVIDDDVFETAFPNAVTVNDEGEIVGTSAGKAAEGVPFTAEAVDRLLTSEPMASPGAACLALAWEHREHLLG